mmetsp:Transcript_3873/g.12016  ORF Transcript_3873/g.12016 Transcript_3873/m.12016 type:complete len:318 (-) Transcript_3873:745-1698(-)
MSHRPALLKRPHHWLTRLGPKPHDRPAPPIGAGTSLDGTVAPEQPAESTIWSACEAASTPENSSRLASQPERGMSGSSAAVKAKRHSTAESTGAAAHACTCSSSISADTTCSRTSVVGTGGGGRRLESDGDPAASASVGGGPSASKRERMACAASSACLLISAQTDTPNPNEIGSGATDPSASAKRCAMGFMAHMASSTRRDVRRSASCSHAISCDQRSASRTMASPMAGSTRLQWASSVCSSGSSGGGGTCPSCRCWAAVTSTLGPSESSATTTPSAGTPRACNALPEARSAASASLQARRVSLMISRFRLSSRSR